MSNNARGLQTVICGEKARFAIESQITHPLMRLSQRGIGYFVIYICGTQYGLYTPLATLLACSFDAVGERMARAGQHQMFFLQKARSTEIVDAVIASMYDLSRQDERFFGIPCDRFREILVESHTIWAPDGDQAFDEGSHVLQFDEGSNVRVIGFKNSGGKEEVRGSISEVYLQSHEFYAVLSQWHDAFHDEWKTATRSLQQ